MRVSAVDAADEPTRYEGANMTPSQSIIPAGLCQCGCGKSTSSAPKKIWRTELRKGDPRKYLKGHKRNSPLVFQREDASAFKIQGEPCRVIRLTNGGVCIVSASDYDWLSQWNWRTDQDNGGYLYVVRCGQAKEGKVDKIIRMHRQILGLEHGDPRVGDHRDPWDTLNNSRANLRIATLSENARNCKRSQANTSGFKGVYFDKRKRRFRVRVTVGAVKRSFGSYATAEQAHEVYTSAVNLYHGEFARAR